MQSSERVEIRTPSHEDVTEWGRMRHELWPDGPLHEHIAELGQYFVPGAAVGAFVAQSESGSLVGFIELSLRSYAEGCATRPVGYIEGWYVDLACRRRGIGTALVVRGEQWAVERGCTEMASDTELDNTISRRAHGRLGYAEVERLIHFRKSLASE